MGKAGDKLLAPAIVAKCNSLNGSFTLTDCCRHSSPKLLILNPDPPQTLSISPDWEGTDAAWPVHFNFDQLSLGYVNLEYLS
jgi:hypothetical protein